MSKATKIWLTVSAALILSGIITFAVAIIALEFDFSKLSTSKYTTKTHFPEGSFEEIIVDTNLSDIDFLLSPDGKCKVVSMEEENISHTVEVKDGRLTIKAVDNRKWHGYIGISWENQYLTVYLPETEYKALFVETSVGKVKVSEDFYFETIDLSGNTGDFELTNVTCNSFKADTDTGDISLTNVTCNSFKADTDTGDISLKNVIAKGNLTIETDTGDYGSGATATLALENMEQTTAGVIYLDTAEYLLLSKDAEDAVQELRSALKPETQMCYVQGDVPTEQAGKFLSSHGDLPELKDWENGQELPIITAYEERITFLKKVENSA